MSESPAPPARRLSLAVRIFLLIAGLLALAIGSAVLVSLRLGSRIADDAVNQSLQASAALQSEFSEQRLQEVRLKVQLIGSDPSFVNYISDSQVGAAGVGDTTLAETASIYDLLLERQEAFGFDLGLVLDHEGNVLARTDQPEAYEESLAEDPFVADSIRDVIPLLGYWRMGNQIYQAAILPLAQGQDLVGFLMIAKAVDDGLSQQIRRISDADIAFLIPVGNEVALIGTSLADSSLKQLRDSLAADAGGIASAVREGKPLERLQLAMGDGHWIGRLSLLDVDGGAPVGSALQLTSSDRAEAGYRQILNAVAVAGMAALVFALPLSLLLAKATLKPLRTMAKAAKEAVGGNYQARFAAGGSDELAELSTAFDSLLSDLRGERDIESYVTHLSRLLPEPGDEPASAAPTPTAAPARKVRMSLIGIDTRKRLLPAEEADAGELLRRAQEFTAALRALAREFGGELLASSGSRLTLGFAGDDRRDDALRCARELLLAEPELALSAIDGVVVLGTVDDAGSALPGTWGVAVQQLDRLLAEANAAQVILPKALGDELKLRHGDDTVHVAKGAVSGKPFYAATAEALQRLPAGSRQLPLSAAAPLEGNATVSRAAAVPAPSTDLPSGARLGGRFRVLSVLGSGGMGVVYKARDLDLDDVVALKMLKGEALADREQLERLKSEIKLARRITHPNVLRTFDFGEIDGQPFISMEYVRGMTLRYLIKQSERVPYTAALRIARQLCAGLQAAHEVGVLHRDIKPENLILEASGNAKLMDFGIARPIRRSAPGSTEPGMYVGTPAYSAPEQLAGQDVDHRADIFASGVLMSEMFCGQLPFAGNSTVEIYMAQMNEAPRRPRDAWPEVPAELERIILRCIERRPDARFQSVAELGAALNNLRA